jgi:tetratricopeptide (TPR) repeat protein
MFELKTLSPEAVPAALQKALRYRMLNEPEQAASICEDVLHIDPDNQEAVSMWILALTDGFGGPRPVPPKAAHDLLPRLSDPYEREYYAGIIWERAAIARLRSNVARSGMDAFDHFRQALRCFERAEALRPPGNDDALLRWNSCARMILNHPDIVPVEEVEEVAANLGE